MFTVTGYVNGVLYTATVDGAPPRDPADGVVTHCSPGSALSLLHLHTGRKVDVTPVGPHMEVGVSDPAAVLAGLIALTEVVQVTGDAPDLLADPDAPRGVMVDH